MSLIWGGTWVAVKAGVNAVPPIFFASLRYGFVAAVLVIAVRDCMAPFAREVAVRTVLTGLLINTGTYAFLFWGIQFVDSGVAGLINLSLVPVGLFVLSVLIADERPSWRHALALALGTAGLFVLFSNGAPLSGDRMELWGALAIVAGTFCYCLGTVLSRPLVSSFAPLQLTAAHAVVGAIGLLALAAALEPLSGETVRSLGEPVVITSLLFLVLFGTVVAYTIYLKLVRDWGAPRAGLYPFLSPIVALFLGWLLLSEEIDWSEIAGTAIMLVGAALALVRPTSPSRHAICDSTR
jgi:drug/metabolite transporter (DMT)-like permease